MWGQSVTIEDKEILSHIIGDVTIPRDGCHWLSLKGWERYLGTALGLY